MRPVVLALLLCAGCKSPPTSEPAPPAVVVASAAESSTPAAKRGDPGWKSVRTPREKLSGHALLERGPIAKLATEKGQLVVELDGPAKAVLLIATKADPLLPRSRTAHYRIAELIAPGVVAPTAFRLFTIAELSRAADKPTLRRLERDARVLENGRVEAVLSLSPSPSLQRVDIANIQENQPAWRWEGRLVTRTTIPEEERVTLAQYQSLIAVDWVAGNLARRYVRFHKKSGRITVADENEAFSPEPHEAALKDGLQRFARHMTYSKSLSVHLHALEHDTVEKALRAGDPPSLIVTPKQVDEIIEHARGLERVIQTRVKQRGPDGLLLP